jgi:two-component system LytT family response regulator
MPDGSGFDLLAQLDRAPSVIFTTAFSDFAIKAFDVNALDYLVKPIAAPRLAQALAKLTATTPKPDEKIFIKDGERCWFVALDRVSLFESEGNYSRLYFDGQRPLLARTLAQLEARLDPEQFLRVSRRHIVNLLFVRDMTPDATGGMILTLEGGVTLPMSRRRATQFKQLNRL